METVTPRLFRYSVFYSVQARIATFAPFAPLLILFFLCLTIAGYAGACFFGFASLVWSYAAVFVFRIWSPLNVDGTGVTQCAGPLQRTLRWGDILCVRKVPVGQGNVAGFGKAGVSPSAKFQIVRKGGKKSYITFLGQISDLDPLLQIFAWRADRYGFDLLTKDRTLLFAKAPPYTKVLSLKAP